MEPAKAGRTLDEREDGVEMAKTYKVGSGTRVANVPFKLMARLGLGADYRHILSVRGRKTGKIYSVPVDVMSDGDDRWLVAPYGEVGWVRNARAAREVTLARGGHRETVRVEELSAEECTPVLRKYLTEVSVTRPYFDVTPSSSDQEFAAEAPKHPAFRILSPNAGKGRHS